MELATERATFLDALLKQMISQDKDKEIELTKQMNAYNNYELPAPKSGDK